MRLAGLIFRTMRKCFCDCARSPKTLFCPAEPQSRLNIGPSALKMGRLCTKTTNLVLYSCMSFRILPLVIDWPWYIPSFKSHIPNLNKLQYVQSKGYERYHFVHQNFKFFIILAHGHFFKLHGAEDFS